jgi:SAM-dependent methyltransferase
MPAGYPRSPPPLAGASTGSVIGAVINGRTRREFGYVVVAVLARFDRVPETHFDEWIAARYETLWPELFEPALVGSTVSFLAAFATGGPALEFGIGTGRIALPLSRSTVRVHGIELSPAMVARLRGHPDSSNIDVILGDFATATAAPAGTFALVYLLRNTITNLITQTEQVKAFANAAAHLRPGGCFVIENYVPELQRLLPGETTHVFVATPDHLGYERYDVATQTATSHHYWTIDGRLTSFSSPHRYVWPSELDLMARLAGLRLRERWADWDGSDFTSDSRSHVSVWQKPQDSGR